MLQMNPLIRSRWTAKLRSDEFEQGTGKLNYIDQLDGRRKNCCLGVLCELAVEDGIITSRQPSFTVLYGEDDESVTLPREVVKWAGVTTDDPVLFERPFAPGEHETPVDFVEMDFDEQITCAMANDSEQMTFLQIADLIDGGDNASS